MFRPLIHTDCLSSPLTHMWFSHVLVAGGDVLEWRRGPFGPGSLRVYWARILVFFSLYECSTGSILVS